MTEQSKFVLLVDGRESLLLCLARDLTTFGALVGTALILNLAMPPSGWLNAALAIVWIIYVFGRSQRHKVKMTLAELHDWLAKEQGR